MAVPWGELINEGAQQAVEKIGPIIVPWFILITIFGIIYTIIKSTLFKGIKALKSKRKKHPKMRFFHHTKTTEQGMEACPKCDGTLKKRHGRHGSFIGCSNFPKCKYTRNTTQQ